LNDVQVFATSKTLSAAWLNKSSIYRIENDLDFTGALSVKGEDDRVLENNDLIRGGERLIFSGLTVVYEATSDLYPPADEYNITIWDELGNNWITSTNPGESLDFEITASNITDEEGNLHIINISEIPLDCDPTDEKIILKIDGDNITFSQPSPNYKIWQTTTSVPVKIKIADSGGGVVDGNTIYYSVSDNDGITWDSWESVSGLDSNKNILVEKTINFVDGDDNLVKWRALDSLGNGPTNSDDFKILVDTKPLEFSNFWPDSSYVSPTNDVEVSIIISDHTSGVDASTIEYSISVDSGTTWGAWQQVTGINDSKEIIIHSNITFSNGTDNIIQWRAKDIAGNGFTESQKFEINVNTWISTKKPMVILDSPQNAMIVNSTSFDLQWTLEDPGMSEIVYDLYLSNFTPPQLWVTNITETSFKVVNLVDGETYYWRVIPKFEGIEGTCISGIWWFSIDLTIDIKKYKLDISTVKSISLYPGESKNITISITNLGLEKDVIKLEVQSENLTDHVALDNNSLLYLMSRKSAQRILTINLPDTVIPDNYTITLVAISMNSGQLIQ
jgi:hypothetical protein